MIFGHKTSFLCMIIYALLSTVSFAATNVGGPIRNDTTWTTAGSPYLIQQNVNVYKGVTLTIKPGVRIEFKSTQATQKMFIDGQLVARGTVEKPIIFTLEDGTRNWNSIEFTENSIGAIFDDNDKYKNGSIIEFATIEYGQDAIIINKIAPYLSNIAFQKNERALLISNCITTVRDCVFEDNDGDESAAIRSIDSDLTIEKCLFSNNQESAVYFTSSKDSFHSLLISDCKFENNWSGRSGAAIKAHDSFVFIGG